MQPGFVPTPNRSILPPATPPQAGLAPAVPAVPVVLAPSAPDPNAAPTLHVTTQDTYSPQTITQHPNANPPEIILALQALKDIQPLPGLDAYARSMGIDVIFKNGQEALDLIQRKGITVAFGDMGDTTAHAQWLSDQNLIMINQKYRGNTASAMVYALSEAIFHEAGHAARSGDNQSSIQEETNCLFLNAWANAFHQSLDPDYANTTQKSELLSNGVALYNTLFFKDPDPTKAALVRRIALKYGVLPLSSPDHPAQQPVANPVPNNLNNGWWLNLPAMADRVVRFVHNQQAAELFGQ